MTSFFQILISRRSIAIIVLVVISLALTFLWNRFAGVIYDFAGNLYWTGLASIGCALLIHQLIIRRVLHRDRFIPQLVGVFLAGMISIVVYDWFRHVTARFTYTLREGTSISWGDSGMSSGLPSSAFGLSNFNFWTHLPVTLESALAYGVVWFPFLVLLERWVYADELNTK